MSSDDENIDDFVYDGLERTVHNFRTLEKLFVIYGELFQI